MDSMRPARYARFQVDFVGDTVERPVDSGAAFEEDDPKPYQRLR